MGTVLVTGGAGYIGSHACLALAAAGKRPVTYDDLSRGHREAVRWGPFEEGHLEDTERLDAVFRRHRPEAVMHFAAYAYVGESVQRPDRYYRNNVGGSLALLEAAREHGIRRFIFSSTCNAYGMPRTPLLGEDHPLEPINPYGASKVMIERMLADFDAAFGLPHTVLRYFNAAGADPEGRIGELHDPEPHLIPLVLRAAAGRVPALEIYGDDYPTPDGTCVRDYIHVTDIAQAHCQALERLEAGGASAVFNLGTGRGFSVREVLDAAERVTGRPVPARVGPRRPGDAPILVADATRARRELGFRPIWSGLDRILETAWAWERARGGAAG